VMILTVGCVKAARINQTVYANSVDGVTCAVYKPSRDTVIVSTGGKVRAVRYPL